MPNIIVIGSQWGDEGKGKIVDILTEQASAVVRFQGGANAGHTVMFGDKTYILHLIPSGILHDKKTSVIGNGVVVDPDALLKEIDELKGLGISCEGKLIISDSANLILPYHKVIDQARESNLKGKKIGTTGRGIGPSYEDKVGRIGIRFIDIEDTPEFKARFFGIVEQKNAYIKHVLNFDGELPDAEGMYTELMDQFSQLEPYLDDTSLLLDEAIQRGENLLFEGAQGTFLDIDHGTYPYVTSSNTTAGGACTGSGVAPNKINGALGIVKAYTTRVGSGPFPTELLDDMGEFLRQEGGEFGATTGRPRRCGWFDACLLKESVRLNGLTGLAITKLDVLDKLEKIKICVAYKDETGKEYSSMPHAQKLQDKMIPVYEEMDGWQSSTVGMTNHDDLPEKAKAYLRRLQELIGAEIVIVSTGPKREQTIIVKNVFAS